MNDKLIKAASEYLKAQGLAGWSQNSNAKFFYSVICKLQAQDATQEAILGVMQVASNSSAFRQRLEKAGVITKDATSSKASDMLGGYDL